MGKIIKKLGPAPPRDRGAARTARHDHPAARAAARALPLHEAHPAGRGPAGQPLPPEQGGRRPLLQPRPGGDLGRQRLRARAAGRDGAAHPQPGLDAGARRQAARGHDAVHGQERQPDRRQGRQHPLRRPDARPGGADLACSARSSRCMAGVALAGRMQKKDLVALTYIGDGGTSTGDFHEGLNFAAVQHLPFVLDRREQRLGLLDADRRSRCGSRTSPTRAAAYGIPGEMVDGNDVLAVYEATKRAVDRARAGGGPTLIEAKTFRMKGHAEHDDAGYVPPRSCRGVAAEGPDRALRAPPAQANGARKRRRLEAVIAEIDAALERRGRRGPRLADAAARAGARRGLRAGAGGGVAVSTTTYLEAVRRRCWEEMERRRARLHARPGHRHLRRRLPRHRRLPRALRPGADHRHADLRVGHGGCGDRRRHDGPAAGRRDAVHRLHRLRLQPDRQLRRPPAATAGARRCRSWCAGPSGGNVHGSAFHSQNPESYLPARARA